MFELNVPIVKLLPPKSNVPAVTIHWEVPVYVCVASNVNVTPVPFTPIPPNCLLNWGDQVCVLVKTGANPVYVPPVANVNVSTLTTVPATELVVPVKVNALNQLPVVIVGILAPLVSDKLGALLAKPPVVPNVNVLVNDIALVKPPVPVQVNPVALAISKLTSLEFGVANTILPEPNAMERVFELFELNRTTDNVKLAKSKVPEVK